MKLSSTILLYALLLFAIARGAEAPVPGTTAPASYHLQTLPLGGTTRTDKWLAMNYFNYSQAYYGYGSNVFQAKTWSYAMRPNFPGTDSTALFNKGLLPDNVIPGGHTATEGIYTMFSRTPFVLTESNPLAGLKTVSLQIYLTTGGDTTAYGVDGDLYIQPTLHLLTSEGSVTLGANFSTLYASNQTEFDHTGGDVEETFLLFENYRQFQWDLSSVTGSILSFEITFSTYEHVSLRSIQLDQSDAVNAVPEPVTYAALMGMLLLIFAVSRRRSRADGLSR